jgi:hypothetical protein
LNTHPYLASRLKKEYIYSFWSLLACYRAIFTFTLNSPLRDLCDDFPERRVVARGQVLIDSADTNPPQDRVGPCDVLKLIKVVKDP